MTASSDQMIRAFIAVNPGDAVRNELLRLQGRLERELAGTPFKIRWVEPEAMHLTLHFLGDIPVESVPWILENTGAVTQLFPRFGITLANAGCFGRPNAPRVLWVGLTAPPELLKLQQQLTASLAGLGIEPEGRPFHPHLTLGRVRAGHGADVFHVLRKTHVGPLSLDVSSVELIQSKLLPTGPKYTVLGTALLR